MSFHPLSRGERGPEHNEEAAQLVLAGVRDLDLAMLTPWSDRHMGTKMLLQRLLESDQARRFGTPARRGLFLAPYLGFRLSYREACGEDVVAQTQLLIL